MREYLPAVPADFGLTSELVRDIDMASAATQLQDRAFDLHALEMVRKSLIQAELGNNAQESLQSMMASAAMRWPDAITTPSTEDVRDMVSKTFRGVAGREDVDIEEVRKLAKASLGLLHPDINDAEGSSRSTASLLTPLLNMIKPMKVFSASRDGDVVSSTEIDADISQKLAIQKSWQGALAGVAAEVNDPNASTDVLAQSYAWLDVTSSVSADLEEATEKLAVQKLKEPINKLTQRADLHTGTISLLIRDHGGYEVRDDFDQRIVNNLQRGLDEVPEIIENIQDLISANSSAELEFLKSWHTYDKEELAFKDQTARLQDLIESGQSLDLYSALDEVRKTLRTLSDIHRQLKNLKKEKAPVEENDTAIRIGRLALSGILGRT